MSITDDSWNVWIYISHYVLSLPPPLLSPPSSPLITSLIPSYHLPHPLLSPPSFPSYHIIQNNHMLLPSCRSSGNWRGCKQDHHVHIHGRLLVQIASYSEAPASEYQVIWNKIRIITHIRCHSHQNVIKISLFFEINLIPYHTIHHCIVLLSAYRGELVYIIPL